MFSEVILWFSAKLLCALEDSSQLRQQLLQVAAACQIQDWHAGQSEVWLACKWSKLPQMTSLPHPYSCSMEKPATFSSVFGGMLPEQNRLCARGGCFNKQNGYTTLQSKELQECIVEESLILGYKFTEFLRSSKTWLLEQTPRTIRWFSAS